MKSLPKNGDTASFTNWAEHVREGARYETRRIASLRFSADREADLFGGARFGVPLPDGGELAFIRVGAGSYVDGFPIELRDRILSIKNRNDDLELWRESFETDRRDVVTVGYDYFMSETIVTNAVFRLYVQKTGYSTVVSRYRTGWYVDGEARWRQGIANEHAQQPWPMSEADRPVTLVSWFDAMSFAHWLSRSGGVVMRLPTKEEWILAGRPEAMRNEPCIFPWGNDLSGIDRRMNFATSELADHMWVYDQYADGHAYTSPAKAYPSNERGLYDMLGNVWVWSFTNQKAYASRGHGNREATVPDLMQLGAQSNDVLSMQGGCYLARLTHAHLYSTMGHPAMDGACDIGFRLVAVRAAQAGVAARTNP